MKLNSLRSTIQLFLDLDFSSDLYNCKVSSTAFCDDGLNFEYDRNQRDNKQGFGEKKEKNLGYK